MYATRAGVAAALAALSLVACGSAKHASGAGTAGSGTGSGTGTSTTASGAGAAAGTGVISLSPGAKTIAAAVIRSSQAPGEKLELAVAVSTPSFGTVSISGSGSYDNTAEAGQLAATVSLQVSHAGFLLGTIGSLLSGLSLQVITHDTTIYAELPGALAELLSSYTGGKPWLELNLAQLATNQQFGPLAELLDSGGLTNPIGALEGLLKGAAQNFHRIGTARVDGASTTEYGAEVDLADLEGALTPAQRREIGRLAGVSKLPYAIYVDGTGRIRRIAFSVAPTVAGVRAHVVFATDIVSYGAEPAPPVPAAGQTANLAKLLSILR